MNREESEIIYELQEMQKERLISMEMIEEVLVVRMKEKVKI